MNADKKTVILEAMAGGTALQPSELDRLAQAGQDLHHANIWAWMTGETGGTPWYRDGWAAALTALMAEGLVVANFDEEDGWFYQLATDDDWEHPYIVSMREGRGGFNADKSFLNLELPKRSK